MQYKSLLILTVVFTSLALVVDLAFVNESPPTNSYALQKDAGVNAGSSIRLSSNQQGQGSRLIYNVAQDLGTAFTITTDSYSAYWCKDGENGGDG